MGKKGKVISGIAGAVVVLGLISGCTGENTHHNTASTTPKTTQPAPAPTQNTNQQDYDAWWGQMSGPFETLRGDVSNVSDLMMEGANNPDIIGTQDYQDRVQEASDQMRQDAQVLLDIPAPSNPDVAVMHNEIIQGVEQIQYVANNLPTAINTMDGNIIQNCTSAFQSATQHFKNATDLLDEFKANN